MVDAGSREGLTRTVKCPPPELSFLGFRDSGGGEESRRRSLSQAIQQRRRLSSGGRRFFEGRGGVLAAQLARKSVAGRHRSLGELLAETEQWIATTSRCAWRTWTWFGSERLSGSGKGIRVRVGMKCALKCWWAQCSILLADTLSVFGAERSSRKRLKEEATSASSGRVLSSIRACGSCAPQQAPGHHFLEYGRSKGSGTCRP